MRTAAEDLERAIETLGERLQNAEAEKEEACSHLERLVEWGHGEGAPDDAKRDWSEARRFLDPTVW